MMSWEDKFKDNLLQVLYREDQCRVPAGSPAGGQFASCGLGGSGGGTGSPEDRIMRFVSGPGERTKAFLKTLPPTQLESVVKAIEDTLGQYEDVKINDIYADSVFPSGVRLTPTHIAGFERYTSQSTGTIVFHSKFFPVPNPESGDGAIANALAEGERAFRAKRLAAVNAGGIRHDDLPTRGSVSAYTNDCLYAVTKHEAYHAVYERHKLGRPFAQGLKNTNVPVVTTINKVSDYAQANVAEAFAETGTAVDMGVKIPQVMTSIFQETVKDVRIK